MAENGEYKNFDNNGNLVSSKAPQTLTINCSKDGTYYFSMNDINSANVIIEPAASASKSIIGDVNADGQFNAADLVTLQKWLLAVPNVTLANWKAGDLCEDGRIDVFDLIMMRKLIVNN